MSLGSNHFNRYGEVPRRSIFPFTDRSPAKPCLASIVFDTLFSKLHSPFLSLNGVSKVMESGPDCQRRVISCSRCRKRKIKVRPSASFWASFRLIQDVLVRSQDTLMYTMLAFSGSLRRTQCNRWSGGPTVNRSISRAGDC